MTKEMSTSKNKAETMNKKNNEKTSKLHIKV